MSRSNIAAILRSVELAKQQRVKRNHTTAPVIVVDLVDEEEEAYARFTQFETDYATNEAPDCKAVTPGLVKVSLQAEPKSIYSPAPAGPIRFERPKKRMGRDPLSVGTDCELPRNRLGHRVFTVVNDSGAVTARVLVNQFSRKMKITQRGIR